MAGRALTDYISLGVLASRVPRDAVDDSLSGRYICHRTASSRSASHVRGPTQVPLWESRPTELRTRAKDSRTSYDSVCMKISTVVAGSGAVSCPVLLLAHVVPWWQTAAAVAIPAGILIYRLLAERVRRKTLETTYRHAPAGTVVVLGEGPGGPPMWIQVGEGQRPEQPTPASVRERVLHRRQAPSGGQPT